MASSGLLHAHEDISEALLRGLPGQHPGKLQFIVWGPRVAYGQWSKTGAMDVSRRGQGGMGTGVRFLQLRTGALTGMAVPRAVTPLSWCVCSGNWCGDPVTDEAWCRGVRGVIHRNTGLILPKSQPSESLVLAPGCPWRASGQLPTSPSHREGSRRGLSSTSVHLSVSISSVCVSRDAFPAQAPLFIFASLRPGPGEAFPVC